MDDDLDPGGDAGRPGGWPAVDRVRAAAAAVVVVVVGMRVLACLLRERRGERRGEVGLMALLLHVHLQLLLLLVVLQLLLHLMLLLLLLE